MYRQCNNFVSYEFIWLVSCYAHVFVLVSIVIVKLPVLSTLLSHLLDPWTSPRDRLGSQRVDIQRRLPLDVAAPTSPHYWLTLRARHVCLPHIFDSATLLCGFTTEWSLVSVTNNDCVMSIITLPHLPHSC